MKKEVPYQSLNIAELITTLEKRVKDTQKLDSVLSEVMQDKEVYNSIVVKLVEYLQKDDERLLDLRMKEIDELLKLPHIDILCTNTDKAAKNLLTVGKKYTCIEVCSLRDCKVIADDNLDTRWLKMEYFKYFDVSGITCRNR